MVFRISHYQLQLTHITKSPKIILCFNKTHTNLTLQLFLSCSLSLIIMIYTYSPNWFKPQCLHFSLSSLYYCSNYILYEYSLLNKKIDREKCFRQISLEYNLNHKDIKISAISSNQTHIYVGLNQPYLTVLDRHTLDVIRVLAIEGFQSIEYIYPYKEGQMDMVILCNKDGNLLKYSANEENHVFHKVDIKHKLSAIKAIFSIDGHYFAVFTRGPILIYNNDFTVLEKVIEASFNDTIYSVDCHRQQQKVFFAFLVKNKQSHSIILFQFKFKQEFPLELKKKIGEIGENIKKFDINIFYPKKMSEKLKQHQKASLSIKMLSKQTIIITGKLGEVVTLHTEFIKNDEAIAIKPYSYQQEEIKQYEIWSDTRHYRQIYQIYQHCNRLYIISTDHNLTVWERNSPKSVKYVYTIKFLTSSVQSFFYSESDPRNIFALLKDSVVRSFVPFDQGSHQLNQYWKFSKRFKIKKAVCHPCEQGILALATQCNHIQLYDIYEDRLMKLVEVGEEILNVSFQFPTIHQEIQLLLKYELKEVKLKTVSHFVKEIENKTVLLVQTKDNFIVVSDLAQKQLKFFKGPRAKKIERIHENRYWDGELLLSSQVKNNILTSLMLYKHKPLTLQVNLKYQQGRVLFKKSVASEELTLINFKGSKFTIFRSSISPAKEICEVHSTSEICLQNPIDYLFINYHDDRIAIYGQRDDSIIVMQLHKLLEEKYEVNKTSEYAQMYWINTKIDSLMFYLEEYLITATKDQTIKVIKYSELSELKKGQKKNGYITKITNEDITSI